MGWSLWKEEGRGDIRKVGERTKKRGKIREVLRVWEKRVMGRKDRDHLWLVKGSVWVTSYQSSQFWFHIKSSHSLPSLSKKHISLCQLLTIELSVAEFKSPGCDSCGPWSGVSQRAGQTFLPALWLTMGTITSATVLHSAEERKRRSGGLFSESVNYLAGYIARSAFSFLSPLSLFFFFSFFFSLWPHCLTFWETLYGLKYNTFHFVMCLAALPTHCVGA